MKITFMGAGSTVFSQNVLGDVMCTEALRDSEIALYDIDAERLNESFLALQNINRNINSNRAKITTYHDIPNRREALRGARFVVDAIQVGRYDPCTITDFEVPKKYGLRQTIADTLGIGGIMRALRTIPVLKDFANDMEDVCPDAWFLNYTNPMSMLAGYMQRHTGVKTVGLCHSVQGCCSGLLHALGMPYDEKTQWKVAGINHMGWLLEVHDKDGNDLYPEIRRRIAEGEGNKNDLVRYEYIKRFGYYCTESSEHNAEYNPFFIKSRYPELIERFNIPLDEYPRRCVNQIASWEKLKQDIVHNTELTHTRSHEYASYIMEAMVTNIPYKIGGNVINNGVIPNLPDEACVEVPCLVDSSGILPTYVGRLPEQLAAMNRTHINVHLLAIEAAHTLKKEYIYQAAMLEPHTAAELSIDDIYAMVDDLIAEHGDWLPKYH